ncbi:exosome complex protein Rrp42 [Methanocella arvoryzae]|uniref:Exosome complex component Rrp42 n=1 Tax=Methanocella arvoryzae (strain DSM 22066 / NBRC 105507 / MRE50) TaxID=351160 RepID=RRP42_METAR|nr:exosome complex protein Rrp42 [Methanocella arvoryzae]Q0W2Y7.1 RecName: Full=Exosome complex component Rrp42 [Methanocella arvoryzae MRE50]CAJ37256.1 putative exosome complex exonuclease 2 [Methanocella arvoryzae MRE50]
MSEDVIAEIKRDYIYSLANQGDRADGRKFDEFRAISVETGVINKAEGSARVKIGDSQVVVGVKIQPGEPFPDTPDSGVIITNLELVPLASPTFESGPPREDAIELARVVDRGVRESGAIDLSKLCIESGQKVWMVFIDVHVLDHDGNLMDAASLGAIAALKATKIPNSKFGLGEDVKLPLNDVPIGVTAVNIGGAIMLDPSLDEESVAPCKLTVITNKEGAISGMQKSGVGTLTPDQINHIIRLAKEKANVLREKLEGIQ